MSGNYHRWFWRYWTIPLQDNSPPIIFKRGYGVKNNGKGIVGVKKDGRGIVGVNLVIVLTYNKSLYQSNNIHIVHSQYNVKSDVVYVTMFTVSIM